ncbi:MAG: DUF5706 domain-containing protein [Bacilli bacterium]|jgi:hypothetical protein|nr:DUF5706 domain-containing protein [Bacilli bacterium]
MVEKNKEKEAFENQKSVLEKESAIIYDQLTFVDNKCNFVFAASIALLAAAFAALFGLLGTGYLELHYDPQNFTLWFLFTYWILGFLGSSLISLYAIRPNLSKNTGDRDKNIFFFGDISTINSYSEFRNAICTKQLLENLLNENIQVSKIVTEKNKRVHTSCLVLATTLFPLYPLIILFENLLRKKAERRFKLILHKIAK